MSLLLNLWASTFFGYFAILSQGGGERVREGGRERERERQRQRKQNAHQEPACVAYVPLVFQGMQTVCHWAGDEGPRGQG